MDKNQQYIGFRGQTLLKKLASVALVFLFLISPLAPVFAQEADTPLTPPDNSLAPIVETPTEEAPGIDIGVPTDAQPETKIKKEENTSTSSETTAADEKNPKVADKTVDKDKNNKDNLQLSALSSAAAPTAPQTSSSGTNRLSPEIDNLTGALIYKYSLTVPPGRNSYTTPDVSLIYNSSNETNDSVFGYGWTINTPSIDRINRKGTNNLYSQDYYASSTVGELVALGLGAYAQKVDRGEFLIYNYSSGSWVVTDKNGTTYKYGANIQARMDNGGSNTYRWMLEEVRDTNNNFIRYEYTKANGQIYPSKIIYSGFNVTDGIFEISFTTSPRSDVVSTYAPTWQVTPASRVTAIVEKINGTTARNYALAYTAGHNASRSLLTSLTETGYDESAVATTLPATTFSYQNPTNAWTNASWTIPTYSSGTPLSFGSTGVRLIDLNGDGLLDFIQASGNSSLDGVWLNNGSGWSNASWTMPGYAGGGLLSLGSTTQLLDVNGDGLPDFVVAQGNSSTDGVWLNTGTSSGWTFTSAWAMPVYSSGTLINFDASTQLVDINGDGLPDFIRATSSSSTSAIWLNTGSGWNTTPSSWSTPSWTSSGDKVPFGSYTKLSDLNGDNLPDFIYDPGVGTAGDGDGVWVNNGTNGWAQMSWTMPTYSDGTPRGFTSTNQKIQLMDLNADGLPDIVFNQGIGPSGYGDGVWLNNGSGWTKVPWTMPTYSGGGYVSFDSRTQMADANGDNLPDFVVMTGNSTDNTWLNNGIGWVESAWSEPLNSGGRFFWNFSTIQLVDVNNDGLPDFVVANSDSSTSGVWLSGGSRADFLSKITSPLGGSMGVTYAEQPIVDKNSFGRDQSSQSQYIYVVKSIQTNDSFGNTSTKQFAYKDGKYYYYNDGHRTFAGFNLVTTTDPAGNVTKNYFHQGNSTDSSNGEFSDSVSKIGKSYRVAEYNDSNNLYRLTLDKWDNYNIGANHDFVKLIRETVLDYDGNSGHRDISTEFTFENTNGNLITQTEWGEVTGATDGSFSDIGSDKRITTNNYATNSTTKVVVPTNSTVTDSSATKISETKYYYDTLAYGVVDKGNQTKVEQWKTGSTYINAQKTYNAYGLIATATDPRGKVTTYTSYDSFNLYPLTITDPLGKTTQYVYDYSLGKPKQTTDQNGFVYQTIYDGLDRPTLVKIPDFAAPYSPITKTAYIYTDTPGTTSMQSTNYLDSSNTVDSYQYFDGLGRLIQERKEAETLGNFNVKDTIYNILGLVQKQSLPYPSSGSSKTSATGTTSLYATNTYDPLERILTTVDATGTTSYTYDDWSTNTTDKNGHVKKYYKDANNNLVKVDGVNGASTYTTNYTWDLNGKLTKVTDALSNTRNFTYDGLGRRLTAEDLHTPSDSTYGTWTYVYDDAGNLTQTVSPRALATNYTYNDINQQLTEDYIGVSGIEITYTYGGCPNGVEKLCSVTMTSGANTSFTYNSNGNVASEAKTINSVAYATSYAYDRQGNKLTITYPDSAQAKYTFNTAGLLEKIERKESSGSFTNVISNFDYSPADQVATENYANNVTTTNTYDPNKLYRLTRRLTQNTVPTKLQDLNYTYDNIGNITQIVDASNTNSSKTANYVYDDLNRMTSATITGVAAGQSAYTQTFSYDAIGNISAGPIGTYLYQGNTGSLKANPHAATSINGVNYNYDNDGNLTGNGTLVNTWNYKDQLTQAVAGGVTSTYKYDHTGERATLANGTTTTVYPNDYYNTNGTKKTKSIYAGDQLVATIETVGGVVTPFYIHADHLGSTNEVSDSSGSSVELLDYFPYGAQRISSGSHTDQRQYVGQIYDTNTGLDYLNARYYKADIGRFVSEDPQFWNFDQSWLADPQNQNSYSYGRSNPITLRDPNGLLTIIIPGTFYKETEWSSNGGAKDFISSVEKTFGESAFVINDKKVWSGEDSDEARQNAASYVAKTINEHKFMKDEKLNIIGYSHGGNVGILAGKESFREIDTLVTLGTPNQTIYQPQNVKEHYNVFSRFDWVRGLGEHDDLFNRYGVNTQKFDGAENIDVGFKAGIRPFKSHENLRKNPRIWALVDKKVRDSKK